ncbi:hypothetical protein BX666DRAFT_1910543 [Dichotomocladium elegans]|nr:hypothetical protein BX666DRAFT_1910543 [Dichotomocladium elegans]
MVTTPTMATSTPAIPPHVTSSPLASTNVTTTRQLATTQRPGMNPDNKVVNTMMYANDVLKDVGAILSQKHSEEAFERIPVEIVRGGPNCAFAYESALKEGYKDETFSIALESRGFRNEISESSDSSDSQIDWYEPGMADPGIAGMNEIMRGFEWDESGKVILS